MTAVLTHSCRHGETGRLERDAESFGIPVYRCTNLCGTFFAVVDGITAESDAGELSDLAGTTEAT